MSELADRERVAKRGWAAPGGAHDGLIKLLKIVLPALILTTALGEHFYLDGWFASGVLSGSNWGTLG